MRVRGSGGKRDSRSTAGPRTRPAAAQIVGAELAQIFQGGEPGRWLFRSRPVAARRRQRRRACAWRRASSNAGRAAACGGSSEFPLWSLSGSATGAAVAPSETRACWTSAHGWSNVMGPSADAARRRPSASTSAKKSCPLKQTESTPSPASICAVSRNGRSEHAALHVHDESAGSSAPSRSPRLAHRWRRRRLGGFGALGGLALSAASARRRRRRARRRRSRPRCRGERARLGGGLPRLFRRLRRLPRRLFCRAVLLLELWTRETDARFERGSHESQFARTPSTG